MYDLELGEEAYLLYQEYIKMLNEESELEATIIDADGFQIL